MSTELHQPDDEFSRQFSEEGFWSKLKRYAKAAGSEVVEKALWLFYALQEPGTPLWAKGVIIGALGYFISIADAIPDAVPVVGYSDDLGALALAIAAVALYITPAIKEKPATRWRPGSVRF